LRLAEFGVVAVSDVAAVITLHESSTCPVDVTADAIVTSSAYPLTAQLKRVCESGAEAPDQRAHTSTDISPPIFTSSVPPAMAYSPESSTKLALVPARLTPRVVRDAPCKVA
jgi:hypothetical protein